ncbi:MAG: thymidylate synthase [Methanobacterium sp.]
MALWTAISARGSTLNFGSVEEPKKAKEIYAVVQLYGKALNDLYEGRLPKGWMFGEAANKVYIEMLKDPNKGEQPYTYGQRLHDYLTVDEYDYENEHNEEIVRYNQLDIAQIELRSLIDDCVQSNRICGILWTVSDIILNNPPCFQWFQLRLSEKNKVSLRILFRSHDYGNASFANWGAIIRCFVDEVITPAGGELEELICVSTSAHIYENDMDMVESLIGKIPEHIRRMM